MFPLDICRYIVIIINRIRYIVIDAERSIVLKCLEINLPMAIKVGAILKAGLHPGSAVLMALPVRTGDMGRMNTIITGMAHSRMGRLGAVSKAGATNGRPPGCTGVGPCSSHRGADAGHLVMVGHLGLAARSALVLRGVFSDAAT